MESILLMKTWNVWLLKFTWMTVWLTSCWNCFSMTYHQSRSSNFGFWALISTQSGRKTSKAIINRRCPGYWRRSSTITSGTYCYQSTERRCSIGPWLFLPISTSHKPCLTQANLTWHGLAYFTSTRSLWPVHRSKWHWTASCMRYSIV